MAVARIAVLGSGLMGRGIAYAAAVGGFDTVLFDVSASALEKALAQIDSDLKDGVARGKLTPDTATLARGRIATASSLETAVYESHFVIEAVPEDIALKLDTFARLDSLCPPEVVLATNTSALSVTEIAAAAKHPERVLGMHFFNPVAKMKLVEIVRALGTGEAALALTEEVAHRMGKETVRVRDSAGFVTSRINAMIGNEAFSMLESGLASARHRQGLEARPQPPHGPLRARRPRGPRHPPRRPRVPAQGPGRALSARGAAGAAREGGSPGA